MKTLDQLKRWLRQPGNTPAKLAVALEYETTAPITQWLVRGKIPKKQETRIRELITKED